MNLPELQSLVADCLDRVRKCFKSTARVTILVRHEGDDVGRMDFMMGDDDPQQVAAMVARRIAAAKAAKEPA